MYPMAVDQNRQDNVPTQHTLQVHMHHVCCPCSNVIYPYYPPGYRPPILTQPPPMPRPSYLHHYQYTQLHLNPAYNAALPPTMAQHFSQSNINQSPPSTVDLAFGPPPRDRRNLEGQEYEEHKTSVDKNKANGGGGRDSLQYPVVHADGGAYTTTLPIPLHEGFVDLTAAQVASLSTENYITYLVNGCLTGERIAKRNEHRPCFKNIQNLCNRTRSEVIKPNITVSNIHSQGVPWATKDFIFAFVRAINCWCILRGYLGNRDGNLGKIDREISQEFRACYTKWEKCTKQLTHFLIETFCKLDEINSPSSANISQVHPNSAPSTSTPPPPPPTVHANRTRNPSPPQEAPKKLVMQTQTEIATQTVEKGIGNKEMLCLKGVPGILHIPQTAAAPVVEFVEARNLSPESTEASPRDEDSDSESRVYMKPGSYNVPTKLQSGQSPNNSPRSIEFLDTAQNVAAHHRKLTAEKSEAFASEILRDKAWKLAQSATPDFVKLNEESSAPNQNQVRIENWLNSSIFECSLKDFQDPEDIERADSAAGKPDELNAIPSVNSDKEIVSWASRKRSDYNEFQSSVPKTFRRNAIWEYKVGGLTDISVAAFDRFLKKVEVMDFSFHITFNLAFVHNDEKDLENAMDLHKISKKLKDKKYLYLYEVIHDFRRIMRCSVKYFTERKLLDNLDVFRDKFNEMLTREFPNVDFSTVTGENGEKLGPLVTFQRARPAATAESDGDH